MPLEPISNQRHILDEREASDHYRGPEHPAMSLLALSTYWLRTLQRYIVGGYQARSRPDKAYIILTSLPFL